MLNQSLWKVFDFKILQYQYKFKQENDEGLYEVRILPWEYGRTPSSKGMIPIQRFILKKLCPIVVTSYE